MKMALNLIGLWLTYMLLTTSLISCKKSDPEPEPSQSTVKLGQFLILPGHTPKRG